MEKESYLAPYYQKISNALNDIVPVDWDEIVMYGEELGDISSVGFYFKPSREENYHYSGMIPDEYEVDLNEYFARTDKLSELIELLWKAFADLDMQNWDAIIFRLNSSGNFKIKFEYQINREISSVEREICWAYNELGIIPEDEFSKKILEEYLVKNSK